MVCVFLFLLFFEMFIILTGADALFTTPFTSCPHIVMQVNKSLFFQVSPPVLSREIKELLAVCDQNNPKIQALIRIEEDHQLSLKMKNFFFVTFESSYAAFDKYFTRRVGNPFDLDDLNAVDVDGNQGFTLTASNLQRSCEILIILCQGFANIIKVVAEGNFYPQIPACDI